MGDACQSTGPPKRRLAMYRRAQTNCNPVDEGFHCCSRRHWQPATCDPAAFEETVDHSSVKSRVAPKGTKNSIKAVHDMARARGFNSNLNQDWFLFGPKLDSDGHTYIGSGEDDNPFIVGVTSCALIDACLQFSQSGNAIQFHADATFKLSDLGYPVITCGFTDQARSYQVGAVFVVSQRTEHVYTECFKSFVEIVNQVRGMVIHANTAMSDAEDAQYLALGNVPEFATATRLMFFLHVMYNVRKRTRHLHVHDRVFLMNSILEMHLSRSELAFQVCRDREISKWRQKAHLREFVDYFEQQWLTGRYWRWQTFHNPEGYALTNNPCENLNGGIKHFLQRRRLHMCRLLEKLGDFIETMTTVSPAAANYVPAPTSEVIKAAAALLETSKVLVTRASGVGQYHVLEIYQAVSEEDNSDDNQFLTDVNGCEDAPIPAHSNNQSSSLSLFLSLTSTRDQAQTAVKASSDERDLSFTLAIIMALEMLAIADSVRPTRLPQLYAVWNRSFCS